ncbi:hypothetical protein [Nocardia sp. CA-290969]|uniref:hypothetical protein n=1 Tax=Nocardia sp. CA-290969 TaxID=3239986 RepID=UPI003D8EA0CB
MISDVTRAEITRITGNPLAIEHWTADHLPDGAQLEDYTRKVADTYTVWDSPHQLFALSWDGEKVEAPALFGLDTAIDPARYPAVLPGLIARYLLEHALAPVARPPIVALCLQIEAHTVERDSLTYQQRRAVANRQMHTLPQAQEKCLCLTADIAGRVWWASKTRGTEESDHGDLATGKPYVGGFADLLVKLAEGLPVFFTINEHGGRAPDAFGGSGS